MTGEVSLVMVGVILYLSASEWDLNSTHYHLTGKVTFVQFFIELIITK